MSEISRFPDENDDEFFEREKCITWGHGQLTLQGNKTVQPKQYQNFFAIMHSNDCQLNRSIVLVKLAIESIRDEEGSINAAVAAWQPLVDQYGKISVDVQTEETGRGIIIAMKQLIPEFDSELKKWQQKIMDTAEASKVVPSRITEVLELIRKNAEAYGQLPAYIAYRFHGRFLLDPKIFGPPKRIG